MGDKSKWNQKVSHPLQSFEWGEFRKLRQPIDRQDGMLVVWSKIKFTPWVFGYIPMGKAPSEEEMKRLRDLGEQRKAIGIRMEPNSVLSAKYEVLSRLPRGRNLFKPKTYWWDLTKSEEELLAAMHPKGRYNIKVAQRHGVEVQEDGSKKAFEKYLDLMFGGTIKRQGIYAHSRGYHRQLWNTLYPTGMAKLFTAVYKKEILAVAIVFIFKDKIYYAYGASGQEQKEVMAPTLLMWEVARWGKGQGYKIFDLWGAEEGKGFSRFKTQFGADLVETVGAYDLPVNKWLYPLFRVTEEARWKVIHFIK